MTQPDNSSASRSRGHLALFGIAITVLFLSFLRLGFWQLDRAGELKKLQAPQPEKPIVQLLDIAQPGTNLAGDAVNRRVTLTGHYVAHYRAPGQVNGKQTWDVGLLEIPDIGAILVARSIHSQKTSDQLSADQFGGSEIEITGRLMPRQYDDRAPSAEGTLTRIDSALIVRDTDLALFDGFVIAQSEKVDGAPTKLELIADTPAKPTIPGFYWQHIAYVAIWWLAAAVVLFLPFYQRFRERAIHGQSN